MPRPFGPIGQLLKQTRGGGMMPGLEDEELEMDDMPEAQAVPVHSMSELDAEYRKLGLDGASPVAKEFTREMESLPKGSKMYNRAHANQHRRAASDFAAKNAITQALIRQMEASQKEEDKALQGQGDMQNQVNKGQVFEDDADYQAYKRMKRFNQSGR